MNEEVIIYKCTKFGSVYITRKALEWLAELERHISEEDFGFVNELTCSLSVLRSFVEDVTFNGRPVISVTDILTSIEKLKALQ